MSYCFLMRQPPNPSRTWSRFNQPYNFNNDFSEKELDERRKYEILKYKKNAINNSNKAKLTRILKGKSFVKKTWSSQKIGDTNPNVQNLQRNGNVLIYPINNITKNNSCYIHYINGNKCVSTTRTDVPGKETFICKKENVPLTRFIMKKTYS